jgi:hypothetical protein
MERTEKIHATHKYSFCYIPAFLQVSLAPFVPEINRVLYHTESIQSSDPMRAHQCMDDFPRSKHSILFEAAHDNHYSVEKNMYETTRLEVSY